jgi:hypothetical protein
VPSEQALVAFSHRHLCSCLHLVRQRSGLVPQLASPLATGCSSCGVPSDAGSGPEPHISLPSIFLLPSHSLVPARTRKKKESKVRERLSGCTALSSLDDEGIRWRKEKSNRSVYSAVAYTCKLCQLEGQI